MKRILFFGAATLLAAVSCNKELENTTPVLPDGELMSFIATVDGAETKTVMGIDNGTYQSYWNGTESIRVFDGQEGNGKIFEASGLTKVEKAIFSEVDETVSLIDEADYLAVYPSTPAGSVTWSGNVTDPAKYFWLPSEQSPVVGSFDPYTHVAVAYAEPGTNNFAFKNVVSLICFTIGSDNVSEVRFYGNNNEIIGGNFDVTYNPSDNSVSVSREGSYYTTSVAKVVAAEGAYLEKGNQYYITVLPTDFAEGFTVEIFVNGVSYKYTAKEKFNLASNKVVNVGELIWYAQEVGVDSDWALAGEFNGWSDTVMKTTSTTGLFVAEDVELDAYGEIKVKAVGSWDTSYGAGYVNYINKNSEVSVSNAGSNISVVEAGTYDIYFDITNTKLYLMATGTDYTAAIEQTENGVAPTSTRTIYLKPGVWTSDNAWFVAYTWGGGSPAAMVKMNVSNKGEDYYECIVPKDRTNVIFLRKDPAKTELDWDGEWNRFEMELPSDMNCFNVTGWDGGQWDTI